MSRFIKKQGFTLIELMVVIVIIGVLASLAIPRFTEASIKAKVAEAPRVIASFESAYLAAVAEKGEDGIALGDLIFQRPSSKWFDYETSNGTPGTANTAEVKGLDAKAAQKMGVINKDNYFSTVYGSDNFGHSFSECSGAPEAPQKDANDDDDAWKAKEENYKTLAEAYGKTCSAISKYVPNFM